MLTNGLQRGQGSIDRGVRFVALVLLLALTAAARGEPPSPSASEFFEKEIRPVLADRCFQCHGGRKKVEASLKLTSRADMLRGGDDGPAVVPGKPNDSLLIKAVRY